MENREKIVKLFIDNVKGNIADTSSSNQNHDGKSGHWLEKKWELLIMLIINLTYLVMK